MKPKQVSFMEFHKFKDNAYYAHEMMPLGLVVLNPSLKREIICISKDKIWDGMEDYQVFNFKGLIEYVQDNQIEEIYFHWVENGEHIYCIMPAKQFSFIKYLFPQEK